METWIEVDDDDLQEMGMHYLAQVPNKHGSYYTGKHYMREARIIFPTTKSDPQRWIDWLVAEFGAATCSHSEGYSLKRAADGRLEMKEEPVCVVDVAMHDTLENDIKLIRVAKAFARNMNELCVYVRRACGEVEMVEP